VKQTMSIAALVAVTILGAAVLAGCPKKPAETTTVTPPTTPPVTEQPAPAPAEATAAEPPENIGNTKDAHGDYVCPMCGHPVTDFSPGSAAEYEGKAYFFCEPECKPAFEADPEKYAKAAAAGEIPEGSEPTEGAMEAESSPGTEAEHKHTEGHAGGE